MRIGEAFTTSYREVRAALKLPPETDPVVWLGLLAVGSLFSGAFFAYQDFGKINPVISFIAGCISLPLFLAAIVGGFFGGLFLASATLHMFVAEKKVAKHDGVGAALLVLCWAVLAFAAFWVLLKIPVIGHQIGFLTARLTVPRWTDKLARPIRTRADTVAGTCAGDSEGGRTARRTPHTSVLHDIEAWTW
jgi:hypothetical protein